MQCRAPAEAERPLRVGGGEGEWLLWLAASTLELGFSVRTGRLRQRRLHPAAGFMQPLAAAGILRCGAVVVQRSRRQRCPVVCPAPATAPTPAC